MKLQLPKYTKSLLQSKRYKVLYGGRGSSKSYTIANLLLILGVQKKIRVLCAREFQNSITESVHLLLKQEIDRHGLDYHYEVTKSSITGSNGTEFIFKGVRMNTQSIKSMTGLTHLWIEEAQTISQESWDILIPTIREPNSEIFVSFNPDSQDDPVYSMFVNADGSPKSRDDSVTLKINWQDNPWFPDVLKTEKDRLYSVNPDLADHIWGGKCRTHSDAQIFKNKWTVQEFEPESHFTGPYFGADWGFSNDPTVILRAYINPSENELLIRNAIFGYATELDHLPGMFSQIDGAKDHIIRADSARPETISHMVRRGFRCESAPKWQGSVQDGIEYLKNFKRIVIHPENREMIEEAKNYSYKTDRLSGDVLPDIVDAYNHGFDALRYALAPMIQSGGVSIFDVL